MLHGTSVSARRLPAKGPLAIVWGTLALTHRRGFFGKCCFLEEYCRPESRETRRGANWLLICCFSCSSIMKCRSSVTFMGRQWRSIDWAR